MISESSYLFVLKHVINMSVMPSYLLEGRPSFEGSYNTEASKLPSTVQSSNPLEVLIQVLVQVFKPPEYLFSSWNYGQEVIVW